MALQIHHASRILLLGNETCQGGAASYRTRQKEMRESIEIVCGIAIPLLEEPTTIMQSSQCLFIGKDPRRKPHPPPY